MGMGCDAAYRSIVVYLAKNNINLNNIHLNNDWLYFILNVTSYLFFGQMLKRLKGVCHLPLF